MRTLFFLLSILLASPSWASNVGLTLYQTHCAQCHGVARLGGIGPALLPQNLRRLKKNKAAEVIKTGRMATQMPAFGKQLNTQQISALRDYIFTAPASKPYYS